MDWQRDVSLTSSNTFGLEASTRYFAVADSVESLRRHLRRARHEGLETLLLGGGSNVVLPRRYPGVTIAIKLRGVEISARRSRVRVVARAGENWHQLVRRCIGQGIFGLENLALIPGDLGAAPIQNIGAYGVELSRFVDFVEAMDLQSGDVMKLTREECGFGYRDSVFKANLAGRMVVTRVALSLHAEPRLELDYADLRRELEAMGVNSPRPAQVCEAVIRLRRRKLPDPRRVGNVGSFFKNPVVAPGVLESLKRRYGDVPSFRSDSDWKIPAAWLIEQCGWKGRRCGSVGVSKHHALVIVNLGAASSEDVLALAASIKESVSSRFGIELTEEPAIV